MLQPSGTGRICCMWCKFGFCKFLPLCNAPRHVNKNKDALGCCLPPAPEWHAKLDHVRRMLQRGQALWLHHMAAELWPNVAIILTWESNSSSFGCSVRCMRKSHVFRAVASPECELSLKKINKKTGSLLLKQWYSSVQNQGSWPSTVMHLDVEKDARL